MSAKARADTTRHVRPDDHMAVRWRDGMCFGILAVLAMEQRAPWWPAGLVVTHHQCADRFGNQHPPNALERLTVDHFHHEAGGTKGKRAESDRFHMVAMCGWLNNLPPPASIRQAERAYAAWLASR